MSIYRLALRISGICRSICKLSIRLHCGISGMFRIETFGWQLCFALSSIAFTAALDSETDRLRRTVCQHYWKGPTGFAPPGKSKGQAMRTATGGFLLLLLSVVTLGGCIHSTGPCYGVGCHAFTGAQPQPAAQQNSGNKPRHAHKLLDKLKL